MSKKFDLSDMQQAVADQKKINELLEVSEVEIFIVNKEYDKIIEKLIENYSIGLKELELIRLTESHETFKRILDACKKFNAYNQEVYEYLVAIMGKDTADKYIIHRSKINKPDYIWTKLLNSFISDNSLVENCAWRELAYRSQWEILAKNEKFETIIYYFDASKSLYKITAACLLDKANMHQKIIEHNKFIIFAYMKNGAQLLVRYEKFDLLVKNKSVFKAEDLETALLLMCSHPDGREILFEKGYTDYFIKANEIDFLIEKRAWEVLAKGKLWDKIDWADWKIKTFSSLLLFEHHGYEKTAFYKAVVKSKKFDILVEDNQPYLLLKNGQIKLWKIARNKNMREAYLKAIA